MPTQPNSQAPSNVTFGQRVRDQWWNPNRSAWRNLGQIALNVVRSGGNPIAAGLQTAARAGMGEAREAAGNFARNRGWDFNPFNNGNRDPSQAAPVDPNAWGPPAPPVIPGTAYGPPIDLAAYNNTTPGSAYGPSQRPHVVPFPLANTGTAPRGANRYNGVLATGQAAQDMARGFAGTGLGSGGGGGASSYGRDQLNSQWREA
jgi:hypothetical protein